MSTERVSNKDFQFLRQTSQKKEVLPLRTTSLASFIQPRNAQKQEENDFLRRIFTPNCQQLNQIAQVMHTKTPQSLYKLLERANSRDQSENFIT